MVVSAKRPQVPAQDAQYLAVRIRLLRLVTGGEQIDHLRPKLLPEHRQQARGDVKQADDISVDGGVGCREVHRFGGQVFRSHYAGVTNEHVESGKLPPNPPDEGVGGSCVFEVY